MAVGPAGSIVLQSSDGEAFRVTMEVARESRILATMLNDLGHTSEDVIPLPNVSSRILKKVLAWAEQHVLSKSSPDTLSPPVSPVAPASPGGQPLQAGGQPLQAGGQPLQPRAQPRVPQHRAPPPQPAHKLTQWEKEFIAKNRDYIYDLLLAANYLDIKRLLDILCAAIAEMIKGKDPEDIRRTFNVQQTDTQQKLQPPENTSS